MAMNQVSLFPELQPVVKKELIGKTDYGKRREFCFFLTTDEFQEASKFFNFKDSHDEPDSQLLIMMIRKWNK
jgi:hypothetical protein